MDWIGLDWIHELMDWFGLGQQKWTHVQLWRGNQDSIRSRKSNKVHMISDSAISYVKLRRSRSEEKFIVIRIR